MATTMRPQLIPTQIPSDFRMVSMLDAAYFEDLPAYTPRRPRDLDTLSIYSAAPSYRSEPPNYNDVEPLSQEPQEQESLYSQDISFFDDDDAEDDIVMTELVVQEVTVDEEDEPLTPTQWSVNAETQHTLSLMYPERPPTPVRRRPALPPPVPRRPVPPPPTQPAYQAPLSPAQTPAVENNLQRVDSSDSSSSQEDEFVARGLPRMSWAPGYRPVDAFSASNYRAFGNSLAGTQRNPVRRQYENVVRRRVRFQEDPIVSNIIALASPTAESHSMLLDLPELTRDESPRNSRDNTPQPPSPSTPTATATATATTHSSPPPSSSSTTTQQSPTTPLVQPMRPEEDPELVGDVAAAQARQQREFRALMDTDGARARELESRGWDFMLSQSRDWEERQLSWAHFRQFRMRKEAEQQGRKLSLGGGLLRIVSRGS